MVPTIIDGSIQCIMVIQFTSLYNFVASLREFQRTRFNINSGTRLVFDETENFRKTDFESCRFLRTKQDASA